MELMSFFTDVYQPLKLRGGSHNTVRLYKHSINRYSDYLGREATLEDFDDLKVSTYLARLVGLSPYTIEKERCQLVAMWNFAARRGLVPKFPTVYASRLPERTPMAWDQKDLFSLLGSCKREDGDIDGVPAGKWWISLHLVLWDTGERIGAIRALQWGWLRGNVLHVPAEVRKGKTRDRVYHLHQTTCEMLQQIADPHRRMIFPWCRSETSLYYHYNRILRRAGLPTDCKSKFHRMRKTVATFFKRAGGNPTELLDHQSSQTTKAYLDPRFLEEPQAKDLLFRIF